MYWNEKRYHSLDYHLKKFFGEKVYKIALDSGMTCPNRDGTLGTGGCIFCSSGGSGDFATPQCESITAQIDLAIDEIKMPKTGFRKGTTCNHFIAYFQSYTNTYAPVSYLRKLFTEAILHPQVVGISIATRPDCLPKEVLDLLEELNKIKPVWVELGLQTIHEKTAQFIRRGYTLTAFEESVQNLTKRNLTTIVHIIIGLPFETEKHLYETIDYLGNLPIQGIKLQLLHVLKETDLAAYINQFHILTKEEYINLVINCLERLPAHLVIHRLTGDGPRELLLAPLWSTEKRQILNEINKTLKQKDTWQGKSFSEIETEQIR